MASGELLETDEDFDRLLRKDPNSAEAWIRLFVHGKVMTSVLQIYVVLR